MIDLAHDFFLLPQGNPHLRVFHASGQDFIMNKEWAGGHDLIIVDAFDEKGLADALLQQSFLVECRCRLKPEGVFVMNLWDRS